MKKATHHGAVISSGILLGTDLGFIASGILMIAAGLAAIRKGRADTAPRGAFLTEPSLNRPSHA